MNHIAIFASGSGSNAECIYQHFARTKSAQVSLLVCNNAKAYVLERAESWNLPSLIIDKTSFYDSDLLMNHLHQKQIEWIILAGFLWKIPENIIRAFPDRIINIHPSLLPKYGGKGMYGMHVHREVVKNREVLSGMTIHYVNEQYDEGQIIFQAACQIDEEDRPEDIAQKINRLELKYYPLVIEALINNQSLDTIKTPV